MADSALPKYRNPVWINKEVRSLEVDILIGEDYQHAIVNAGPVSAGKTNKDYDAVLELFGEEEIDRLTKIKEEERELEAEKRLAQQEVHKNRVQQESLFNMKLEAFEIPIIKNSEDKELKKLIRKAKTILEVTAYTTILIQKELEKVDA